MKKVTIEELSQVTRSISAGEEFIYVDGFGKQHNIKVEKLGNERDEYYCKLCAFSNDSCCLVSCSKLDRDNKDDVYFVEQTKT